MPVHNHGTEEGKGLACRELMVNGELLKGECLRQPGDLRTRIADAVLSLGFSCSDADYMADAVIRELETGLSFSERMTVWALLRPDCITTGEIEINEADDE